MESSHALRLFVLLVRDESGALVEWYILTGRTEVQAEKPVTVPLCSTQISDGLDWILARASAARGRQLTACAAETETDLHHI